MAWDVLVVVGLSLAAVGVRLVATRGLWLDDAISVHEASLPFREMLEVLRTTDNHPPLYFVLLWLDVRALGTSEMAVRLPSIVAGSLIVPMLYVAGRELWDRRTGLIAAAFGAVAPLVVWYSQEARMYALFMLLSVLAVWAQARAIRRGGALDWALYVAAAALLVWTHYFAVVQVLVQQAVYVGVAWRRAHRGLSVGNVVAGLVATSLLLTVTVLPVLVLSREQLAARGSPGLSDPFPARFSLAPSQADHLSIYRVVTNGAWAIWGYHDAAIMSKVGALWPVAMLVSLVLLGRRCSLPTALVLSVAFGPPLILAAASLVRPELFEVRYFAGAVPMLVLLLARATTAWSPSGWGATAAASAIFLTLLVGLGDQQLSGSNPRQYDFRGALTPIAERAGPRDVILYAPRYLKDVVAYYAPSVRRRPLRTGLPRPGRGRVFLVASFLDHKSVARRTGRAVWFLEHRGRLVGTIERHKVRTWVFE